MRGKHYLKKYQKMVKGVIPKDYPHRARILGDMQDRLDMYILEHPQATYADLEGEFGAPEELAASLLDSLTSEEVLRLFRRRKRWGIAMIVVAVVAAAAVTITLIRLDGATRAVELEVETIVYEEEPYEEE